MTSRPIAESPSTAEPVDPLPPFLLPLLSPFRSGGSIPENGNPEADSVLRTIQLL